ncbi:ABC transporter substrate-binding protein [Nocardia sp. NPDC049526]|uniref:ABC transporter substrate-binding protein n=1 Tax=Nocardia sp. NPDC049526 TaxID=3364316 RepID=UPI0037B9F3CA
MAQIRRSWIAVATSIAALTLAMTGCTSGGSDSGDIQVMAIGTVESAALSLPDAAAAMKAHVAQINDAGGIKGRKINLTVCNDKFDPNTAADCARQAASKRVVAVLTHYEPFAPQVIPVLEAAKIPYIYNAVTADVDGQSAVSFPRDSGIMGVYGTLGIELGKAGCKRVGAVVNATSNTILGAQWLERGLATKGAAMVQVSVGQTQPDFAAPVAKLLSQDIDCLVPVTAPDQGPKVVGALNQSGRHVQLGAVSSEFGSTALTAMGAAAEGMIIVGQEYRPTDTSVPAVQEVLDGMHRYQPDVPVTTKFAISGWAAVTALQQLLESLQGAITSATVLDALAKHAPDTKLYATHAYGGTVLVAQYPRIVNWDYLTWTVRGGNAVLDRPTFTTMSGL